MASTPRTPPRPGVTPTGAPAPRSAPTPADPPRQPTGIETILEFELSRPIKMGAGDELSTTVRFNRAPGLGELAGWLDETNIDTFQASLQVLPFRPAWQQRVLVACCKLSAQQAMLFPAEDMLRFAEALGPFLSGSRSDGEEQSPG